MAPGGYMRRLLPFHRAFVWYEWTVQHSWSSF